MTEDTRQGDSEAQRGAQRLASDTALPFQVSNRKHRFVDELSLTPHAYRTLADLGMHMYPILHDDDTVAQWLDTADQEQQA